MIVFFCQVQYTHYFSFFFKEDDVFLEDTLEAAAWCRLQQSFTDTFSLPLVIGMEGEEHEKSSNLRAGMR